MATKDGKWDQSPVWRDHVARAKRLGLNCETKKAVETCFTSPDLCQIEDQESLCRYATKNGKWDESSVYAKHVARAKSMGLDCGVGEMSGVKNSKSSFSNQPNEIIGAVKSGIKRLLQLGIVTSQEQSKLEEIIKTMPLAEFSRIQATCESAFTEIQPQKCDEALRSLM